MTFRNNGQKQNYQPGITDRGFWEGQFDNISWPNLVHELLDCKDDDLRTAILRGVVKDELELSRICLAMKRYDLFNQTHWKKALALKILGRAAINGRARAEGVMGGTGVFAPETYQTFIGGLAFSRLLKNYKKQKRNGNEAIPPEIAAEKTGE